VVQAVEDRTCDELAVGRIGRGQFGVRVGNAMDTLMDTGSVVPAVDVLVDDGAKLPFVPDQDAVQQFAAQGADEALDRGLSVRGVVRSGDSPNAQGFAQPERR
jgi:hypothetical protein